MDNDDKETARLVKLMVKACDGVEDLEDCMLAALVAIRPHLNAPVEVEISNDRVCVGGKWFYAEQPPQGAEVDDEDLLHIANVEFDRLQPKELDYSMDALEAACKAYHHAAVSHPNTPAERFAGRLDLDRAILARACAAVREKGEKTIAYAASTAIREYPRHIPFSVIASAKREEAVRVMADAIHDERVKPMREGSWALSEAALSKVGA